jgi:hypothetical protein
VDSYSATALGHLIAGCPPDFDPVQIVEGRIELEINLIKDVYPETGQALLDLLPSINEGTRELLLFELIKETWAAMTRSDSALSIRIGIQLYQWMAISLGNPQSLRTRLTVLAAQVMEEDAPTMACLVDLLDTDSKSDLEAIARALQVYVTLKADWVGPIFVWPRTLCNLY